MENEELTVFKVPDSEGILVLAPIESIFLYTSEDITEAAKNDITAKFEPAISKLTSVQKKLNLFDLKDSDFKVLESEIKEASKEFDAAHKELKASYTPVVKYIDNFKKIKGTAVGLLSEAVTESEILYKSLNMSPIERLAEERELELKKIGGQSYGMDLGNLPEIVWQSFFEAQSKLANAIGQPIEEVKPLAEKVVESAVVVASTAKPTAKKDELQQSRLAELLPYIDFVHSSVDKSSLEKLTDKRFKEIVLASKSDYEKSQTKKFVPLSHKEVLQNFVLGFKDSDVDFGVCSPKYRETAEDIRAKYIQFVGWANKKVEAL